jgi:hypothetical protein
MDINNIPEEMYMEEMLDVALHTLSMPFNKVQIKEDLEQLATGDEVIGERISRSEYEQRMKGLPDTPEGESQKMQLLFDAFDNGSFALSREQKLLIRFPHIVRRAVSNYGAGFEVEYIRLANREIVAINESGRDIEELFRDKHPTIFHRGVYVVKDRVFQYAEADWDKYVHIDNMPRSAIAGKNAPFEKKEFVKFIVDVLKEYYL